MTEQVTEQLNDEMTDDVVANLAEQLIVPDMGPMGLNDFSRLAKRTAALIAQLQKDFEFPNEQKVAPIISGDKMTALSGLTKAQVAYRIKNGTIPSGRVNVRGVRRELTISEAQEWSRALRVEQLKPAGARAAVLGIAFFKGGVTKTSTTMCLAQGLSLLGHKVLCVDLDPQGSLTILHGISPEKIEEHQTLNPLFFGQQPDVRYAITQTYWPNLDVIPANSSLFSSEMALSTRQQNDPGFAFWDVLSKGLDAVRDEYDVILIDTPPALSYVTLNAFIAADGMIVPMTPNSLDLASSSQFWSLFHGLAAQIEELTNVPKVFDFITILVSKMVNSDPKAQKIRSWIQVAYGEQVCPVEIPETAATKSKANEFKTVFDVERYEGDTRTYRRAREAYDALSFIVERLIQKVWARQLGNQGDE